MHVVEPIDPEGQRLAHVTDHDLQLGVTVEDAAGDEAPEVQPRLDAEAEDGAVESGLEHRSDHRVGRGGRVYVEGVAGVGERAEDRIELGVIEILALGVTVDLYAFEAELTGAADDDRP